jgi:hypothetical protein
VREHGCLIASCVDVKFLSLILCPDRQGCPWLRLGNLHGVRRRRKVTPIYRMGHRGKPAHQGPHWFKFKLQQSLGVICREQKGFCYVWLVFRVTVLTLICWGGPRAAQRIGRTPYSNPSSTPQLRQPEEARRAGVAGGRFWGIRAGVSAVKGGIGASSRYSGSSAKTPIRTQQQR